MKKLIQSITGFAVLALPMIAGAQGFKASTSELGKLIKEILEFINSFLIPFVIGIGFLVFVWGMFVYFIKGGHNDEEKEKGKSLMIWATLGFVLIIIFWGVVNLVVDSTGLQEDKLDKVPKVELPR